jgi:predicted nuclease with TOPRIM domain
MGDADLAARLRAHTQQANESAAEKQKLEKERDALLRRTADATQQRRLKRLNAENGQLEKERRELERDLDEVLTQS